MNTVTTVFTIGNPSRGDDALGPLLCQRLKLEQSKSKKHKKTSSIRWKQITVIDTFQLQPENIYDFEDTQLILFIDASAAIEQGYRFSIVSAEKNNGYTTHAMDPAHLLNLFEEVEKKKSPLAFLLSIGAKNFELGDSLSKTADNNLEQTWQFLITLLKDCTPACWIHYTNA